MSRQLKVLAVHRYYSPDSPPYASILRSITTRWAADGHEVEVQSTQPSYKPNTAVDRQPRREWLEGVLVRRASLPREHGRPLVRLLNVALFTALVVRRIVRGGYDVVMVSTVPPVVLAWAASWAARLRGAKFIYHCMDIHPEIGRISGDFANPTLFRALRRADSGACNRATRVVVLSHDMADAVRNRPRDRARIEIINNFELGSVASDHASGELSSLQADSLHVVFTGNVGRFQCLDEFIVGQARLPDSTITLTVMGDGKEAEKLKAQARMSPDVDVRFQSQQDADTARDLIRSADLCLVSLAAGIHQYAFPSKTMTYLAEGKPLLVVMESDSELAQMVDALGIGVSTPPGDPGRLSEVLGELATSPDKLRALAHAARHKGPEIYSRERTLDRWSDLLADIVEETAA